MMILIIDILSQKTADMTLKQHAVGLMEKSGSFEYTRRYLVRIEHEILAEIEKVGGNAELEKVIRFLSEAYTE
jgi:geranylgeranyl diphosphate synthase type 3